MSNLRSRQNRESAVSHKRPGDHFYMAVDAQHHVSTSGETALLLGLSLGMAPVPERKYVADVCHVSQSDTGIKLIFGQEKFSQNQLRSAVVIKMSRRGIGFLLRGVDE